MPEINRRALEIFRNFRPDAENQLAGTLLDDAKKLETVDNGVSTINFFQANGPDRRPVAYLNADPAPVEDKGRLPKLIDATPERLAQLAGKPAEFVKLFNATVQARTAYLKPQRAQVEGATTQYKYNAIVGLRVEQLYDEGTKLAQELYGRDPQKLNQALYAVNTACFDLYSRKLVFDDFEIDGYASFGHDAAFIHAWEKRLTELNKVDGELLGDEDKAALGREKQQIQGELDAIFRSKYVYNNSALYELNAENSVGLCLIDKESRQRVSEKSSSTETLVPEFEILNVRVGAENRAVYFDADSKKHYFDKSDEVVPAALVGQITRQNVTSAACTFRRAESGEHLRKNFRFDWNGDGYVQRSPIDWVSWAGHCDIKAMLETHGLVVPTGDAGVYEYDSRSGSVAHYDRGLLNEMLMSMGELGSEMKNTRTGRTSRAGNEDYKFAGSRDDDRPDRILFGDTAWPYSDRPNEVTITKIVTPDREYKADDVFRQHIVAADERSAGANPLYDKTVEGDRVQLKIGEAAIHARVKFQTFDVSGYPEMQSKDVVIDFKNPAAEPILLDSILADAGKRLMWEISVDTKKKQWSAQQVQMVKKADDSGYERKLVGQPQTRAIDPKKMLAQRETSLDDPAVYMPFVKEALQTAKNFTSETADGAGVWNGRTKSLEQASVWRDDNTKWAKVAINVDARYGGNRGAFLVKLKDDGKPDFFVPLAMPFDFAWRTDAAFAPILGEDVNTTALDRGVVSRVGNRFTAEAVTNMLEVLQCAFNERRFTIQHEGKRYYFADRQSWEQAKTKLDQLRGAVRGGEPGPGPVVGNGTLLEVADGRVAKSATTQYQVVAQADGDFTFTLDTKSGDADLYVNVGGPAGAGDGQHTHKSWNSDLTRDRIELKNVKKGDVIGVAVHGYKASDFGMKIEGPKVGAGPEPEPARIDAHLAGVLARGAFKNLETYPLEVMADGVIELKLQGSGDADVYVGVNREPTDRDHDFRMYDSSSNEVGRMNVKKGDKLYVRVHGYATQSEFDLTVKTA